jgi:cytoskeletal protein CcmA (bactofilin family)
LQLGKQKQRRTLDKVDDTSTTIIAAGSKIVGEISGDDNIVIQGEVVGDCNLQATVFVEDGGKWVGTINASNIVIAGLVEGDVVASEKLEFAATGRIEGNLTAPFIAVAEGTEILGNMHMNEGTEVKRYTDKRTPR